MVTHPVNHHPNTRHITVRNLQESDLVFNLDESLSPLISVQHFHTSVRVTTQDRRTYWFDPDERITIIPTA